jgi:hypothetical protein
MVVELIITGLKGAPWEEFLRYFKSPDPKESEAAIKCGSLSHLKKLLDSGVDEGNAVKVGKSLESRFKRTSRDPVEYQFDSNYPMTKSEFGDSVVYVLGVLEKESSPGVREAFFKALKAATESKSHYCPIEKCTDTFIGGLKEGPAIAMPCAEFLGDYGAERGAEPLFAQKILPALRTASERLKTGGEVVGKIEDAIELIEFGTVSPRGDVEYRKYLGNTGPLRVPMFSQRPAPSAEKTRRPKNSL